MTDADERRVRKALQGLQFPATKQQMLAYIEERGAERVTDEAVRALPDRTYESADDAQNSVPQRPGRT